MTSSFRSADFDALATLYNSHAPSKYQIDADLLKINSVESPVFDWGASMISADNKAFIVIKRSAGKRLYEGPDPDQAHINLLAFETPRAGIELMAEVKSLLRDRGIYKLVFGQDSRHFFPGCPVDFHTLKDFLTVEGFAEGGDQYDVERDLTDYVNPFPKIEGSEYRPIAEADLPLLTAFFDREFPQRWKYDVFSKITNEKNPGIVFGLFIGGAVHGFALLQDSKCKVPIGGAVWRKDLGDHWGSLGPIGVSEEIRGRGEGNALLGAALEHLRDSDCKRTIIDWTGLLKFYGGHGFQPNRQYKTMSLALES